MRVGNDTTIKARARIESESIGVAADTLPITREEARLLWQRAQEEQAHDKGPTNLRLWAKRASIVLKTRVLMTVPTAVQKSDCPERHGNAQGKLSPHDRC